MQRGFRCLSLLALFISLCLIDGSLCHAELFDSLDAYPPRWQLDTSDCDARVIKHNNLVSGGADGGGCEAITHHSGIGSESILVYPIEPVHALNDLVANVSVMSARQGARVGLRVRFPYLRDHQSHRPVSAIIYGAIYDRPGKFQQLGVGSIEREIRIRMAKLRVQYGADANVSDPYVDAIAINAYSGPGTSTLRIDSVNVKGMIPIGDHGRVDEVPPPKVDPIAAMTAQSSRSGSLIAKRLLQMRRPSLGVVGAQPVELPPAFPQNDLIRILEHRDEPLAWVRSLGFDAILLSSPPTAEILREAIKTQLLIYAPPPVAPTPEIGNLLDPVMAWYLGGGVALDSDRVNQTDATVQRLRTFPSRWQRPIVIAPVENWTSYASVADAIVTDAPLRNRGLPSSEQAMVLRHQRGRVGGQVEVAIAIESSSPSRLAAMNQAIGAAIGVPEGGHFRWHSMFNQVLQSLEHHPRAIVFRSHESLVSGSVVAHQRSMALSYTNRFIAMIAPWIASARLTEPLPVQGAAYRCGSLELGGDRFLILTSESTAGDQVLAGDGQAIQIALPPGYQTRTAWRLTNFAAERIAIDSSSSGASVQIVSPDVAELIVISSDATLGARLEQSAKRFSARASSDRWQLCGDQIRQVRQDWDHAMTSGVTQAIMPVDLLNVAQRTLDDAESVYRAGDSEATLRLSRRADAWGIRANVQLSQALSAKNAIGERMQFVSCPPLDEGRNMLQSAWHPLMSDDGWGRNLIALGGLDQPNVLGPHSWTFGRRKIARAESDAAWISRGFFSGQGALRISAASTTGESLGGGYEGTIAVLSSPAVKIKPGQAIRLDAMIKTMGFGGPHQGVLVSDNLGGQEMGVLVRGASNWTPVRLYRQNIGHDEVKLMFELIGDGEAVVDEVAIKVWDPAPLPELPFRGLDSGQ